MRTGWLLVPVLALGGAARGFDVPTRMELRDVPFDVRTVDLPSGMRVVVEKDSSRPLVAVASVVDVGGANDPQGKEGLSRPSLRRPSRPSPRNAGRRRSWA